MVFQQVIIIALPSTLFRQILFDLKESTLVPIPQNEVNSQLRVHVTKGILIGAAVTTVAGIVPGLRVLIPPVQSVSGFPKTLILDSSGNPINASTLPVNSPIIIIFPYPLQNEINFLLNLGDENGNPVEVPSTTVVVPQTGDKY